MASRRMRIRLWAILFGIGLFLVVSVLVLSMKSTGAKTIYSIIIVLALFLSLIHFQLRFYHEGDKKHIHPPEALQGIKSIGAPAKIKSPHHRALWENMDRTRRLMRHKEEESSKVQRSKEKLLLGLCPEEEILFISDRSWLFFWPVSACSLMSLAVGAYPFREFPAAYSFGFLVMGLFGLLLLSAAKSHTRYYLTNFRILIKKQFPWGKARWSALDYAGISLLSRKRGLVWEELNLKSDEDTVSIKGLPAHKFDDVLHILHNNLSTPNTKAQIHSVSH